MIAELKAARNFEKFANLASCLFAKLHEQSALVPQ